MDTTNFSNAPWVPTQVNNLPPYFDPRNQTIVLYDANGTAYDPIPLCCGKYSLDELMKYGYQLNYQYGVIFGLSLAMLLNLFVLTPPEKRRLPLFVLECISLVAIMIRMLSNGLVFSKTIWGTLIMNLALDYSWIKPQDEAPVVVSGLVPLILEFSVFACLFIQTRTILSAVAPIVRRTTMSLLAMIYLFGFCWKAYYIGLSVHQAIRPETEPVAAWVVQTSSWATTASVIAFSAVFAWNIFCTLRIRASMGVSRTDALSILMFVSIESMFIPLVFSLLEHFDTLILDPSGIAMVSIALLLPFGSLWAGTTTYQTMFSRRNTSTTLPTSVVQRLNSNTTTLATANDPLFPEKGYSSPSTPNSFTNKPSVFTHIFPRTPSSSTVTNHRPLAIFPPNNTTTTSTSTPSAATSSSAKVIVGQPSLSAADLDKIYPELAEGTAIHVRRGYEVERSAK